MICESCSFDTDRLAVCEWHSIPGEEWQAQSLAALIVDLMTEPVTRLLPSGWQGEYTVDRALEWMNERDCEGATLLVLERSTGQALGLVILFEVAQKDGDGVDVRLGYLLAESAWGRGLGSELIEGLVRWCRAQASIHSLAGGIERDNLASARVLEKNGFRPAHSDQGGDQTERLFELRLSR